MGVARYQRRHHRTVHHAQTAEAMHAQPCVHHGAGLRIRAHAAGAAGVEDGGAVVAAEVQQRCVVGHFDAGRDFALHERRERAAAGYGAGCLDGGHGRTSVSVGVQVVRLHRRRFEGVGRTDAHAAARLGPQLAHRQREARKRVHVAAGHVGRQAGDMKLDVGGLGI